MNTKCVNTHEEVKKDASVHSKEPKEKKIKWKKLITSFMKSINMEVQLDVAQIPNLKEFVSHLTKTMHSSVPGSLVIWYDSVTKDGALSWQNQLNDKNKPFFDLCDGIFVIIHRRKAIQSFLLLSLVNKNMTSTCLLMSLEGLHMEVDSGPAIVIIFL